MKRIQEEGRIPLKELLPLNVPLVLNVDPSSICNFRCNFCFHSAGKAIKNQGLMPWYLYQKIINDLHEFNKPIKVLRLYAFGEPLLNSQFADMIKYAKDENICETIDTTSNGSLLNPTLNLKIVQAGLDRINISVEGVNEKQYMDFSNYKIDFKKYVENITHLYENKQQCTVFIKINGDVINEEDQQKFLEIFTPICDGIAIEHVMNCWYDFTMNGIDVNKDIGVYGQPLTHAKVCPYIMYSCCVNYNGEVSACFLDWNQRLIMGSVIKQSVKHVWNNQAFKKMRRIMLEKKRDILPICNVCNQLIAGQPENLDEYTEELIQKYEMSNLL
jgi:MoaA/NifB/PqqE/SkfB family radical SAM enzyme